MCFSRPLWSPLQQGRGCCVMTARLEWMSRSSTGFHWHLEKGAPSTAGRRWAITFPGLPFVTPWLGRRGRLMSLFTWSPTLWREVPSPHHWAVVEVLTLHWASCTHLVRMRGHLISTGGWDSRLPASLTPHRGVGGRSLVRVWWGWSLPSPCGLWWQGWGRATVSSLVLPGAEWLCYRRSPSFWDVPFLLLCWESRLCFGFSDLSLLAFPCCLLLQYLIDPV